MKFIKSVFIELKKVSWPTRKQLRKDTVVVFEMVIIFAVLFAIFDTVLDKGFDAILALR
ncbi:MAG: preprotein translocase subunit SecE [Lactobacillales bacterium]|jgi:preprotein translocase subunit SecE|nr:preprotein translocase subunit SecE [Lactobacillales bacterium]